MQRRLPTDTVAGAGTALLVLLLVSVVLPGASAADAGPLGARKMGLAGETGRGVLARHFNKVALDISPSSTYVYYDWIQ